MSQKAEDAATVATTAASAAAATTTPSDKAEESMFTSDGTGRSINHQISTDYEIGIPSGTNLSGGGEGGIGDVYQVSTITSTPVVKVQVGSLTIPVVSAPPPSLSAAAPLPSTQNEVEASSSSSKHCKPPVGQQQQHHVLRQRLQPRVVDDNNNNSNNNNNNDFTGTDITNTACSANITTATTTTASAPPHQQPRLFNNHILPVYECDYDQAPTPLYQAIEARRWDQVHAVLDQFAARMNQSTTFSGCMAAVVPSAATPPLNAAHPTTTTTATHPEISPAAIWVIRKEPNGRLRWRLLPIHAAIIFQAPYTVIESLVQQYPAGVAAKDDQGMLPLHLVLRNQPINWCIVEELLTAHPTAIFVRDRKGRTPLQGGMAALQALTKQQQQQHQQQSNNNNNNHRHHHSSQSPQPSSSEPLQNTMNVRTLGSTTNTTHTMTNGNSSGAGGAVDDHVSSSTGSAAVPVGTGTTTSMGTGREMTFTTGTSNTLLWLEHKAAINVLDLWTSIVIASENSKGPQAQLQPSSTGTSSSPAAPSPPHNQQQHQSTVLAPLDWQQRLAALVQQHAIRLTELRDEFESEQSVRQAEWDNQRGQIEESLEQCQKERDAVREQYENLKEQYQHERQLQQQLLEQRMEEIKQVGQANVGLRKLVQQLLMENQSLVETCHISREQAKAHRMQLDSLVEREHERQMIFWDNMKQRLSSTYADVRLDLSRLENNPAWVPISEKQSLHHQHHHDDDEQEQHHRTEGNNNQYATSSVTDNQITTELTDTTATPDNAGNRQYRYTETEKPFHEKQRRVFSSVIDASSESGRNAMTSALILTTESSVHVVESTALPTKGELVVGGGRTLKSYEIPSISNAKSHEWPSPNETERVISPGRKSPIVLSSSAQDLVPEQGVEVIVKEESDEGPLPTDETKP